MELIEFEEHVFSVDDNRRTMRGVVVPWGKVGSHRNGNRWRFDRGSLKYGHAKFVRFNNDHDAGQGLGRAVAAEDTDSGLVMTFKVNPGPDGDRVLALAKQGRKSGLSVEVEIDPADMVNDPENEGTLLVSMAHLTAVGFVKDPAFDDSRLISVVASKDGKDSGMPEETTETVTPAQPVTFSTDQFNQLMTRLTPQAGGDGPEVIDPTAGRGPAQVTEPQNYVFNADNGEFVGGKHDFGMDFIQGLKAGAGSAPYQRVMDFISKQFDVVSTDVNELNPTVNLPRYIDQRDYQYPVWAAVNRGAPINGIQPFSWPKFSSASGLVAAHTEGTEPSSGTLVTSSQTVTPGAVSGKAKISREVWDMGGTPGIGSLIWRQMLRGWFEALEAKVIAVLDAASPTALGTFTAGGGTTGQTLASEMRAALAKLHFARGGFTFDTAFSQIDLYLALAGALDGQGRPLFPAIGPTNADGTVANRYQSINVNGVPFLPTWGLAATGSVAASSYLIDRLAVDGWATAPQRIDIVNTEVANVYIGIWGYSAAAINDLAGVREITYDPVA